MTVYIAIREIRTPYGRGFLVENNEDKPAAISRGEPAWVLITGLMQCLLTYTDKEPE